VLENPFLLCGHGRIPLGPSNRRDSDYHVAHSSSLLSNAYFFYPLSIPSQLSLGIDSMHYPAMHQRLIIALSRAHRPPVCEPGHRSLFIILQVLTVVVVMLGDLYCQYLVWMNSIALRCDANLFILPCYATDSL
jgi:hypothetical protein